MSRSPAMTSLLNGHAVKVWFASTRVTAMRGSSRLSMRAQVAPAKPPPTTTTRPGAFCASAGIGMSAVAAPAAVLRTSRRLGDPVMVAPSIFLRPIPIRDGLDLVVGEALGDAVHHGRGPLAGAEFLHRADDVRGLGADEPLDRRIDGTRGR